MWAETNAENETTLLFYLPSPELANKVSADGNKLKLTSKNSDLNIFQCKHKPTSDTVLIKIGNQFAEEIAIFNLISFEQRAKENGDSLFFEAKKMDSVNPVLLREAIEKEGITVKTLGAAVVEPPYLEQYFKNVKYRITQLSKRKFFSDYHTVELQTLLENISGGEGIYFITQLLKCFEGKKQDKLFFICNSRLEVLLNETESLNISSQTFNIFFKIWKKF